MFDLLDMLFSPAHAQEGAEDGSDGKSEEEEGEEEEEGGDPNDSGPQGPNREFPERDHDPIHINQEAPDHHEVEVNREHPLGDYSRAMFDYAHELARDLAESVPAARDLKDQFDEAERARDLHESWERSTTASPSVFENEGPSNNVSLISDYQKIEFLGLYLGLSPTSTTGGQHNPNSAHYKAGAVDFSVRNQSPARIEQAMWAMRTAGVYVRDERGLPLRADGVTPQGAWSAPHIHAQSIPTDPRRNGPLDRWSDPSFAEGSFMNYNYERPKPAPSPSPSSREATRPTPQPSLIPNFLLQLF
jgi:hypothetical protein